MFVHQREFGEENFGSVCRQDAMNYGLVQLGEDDYFWATDRLRSIAEAHSKVCMNSYI